MGKGHALGWDTGPFTSEELGLGHSWCDFGQVLPFASLAFGLLISKARRLQKTNEEVGLCHFQAFSSILSPSGKIHPVLSYWRHPCLKKARARSPGPSYAGLPIKVLVHGKQRMGRAGDGGILYVAKEMGLHCISRICRSPPSSDLKCVSETTLWEKGAHCPPGIRGSQGWPFPPCLGCLLPQLWVSVSPPSKRETSHLEAADHGKCWEAVPPCRGWPACRRAGLEVRGTPVAELWPCCHPCSPGHAGTHLLLSCLHCEK